MSVMAVLETIKETLKEELSPKLYGHSAGVAETAAELAGRLSIDVNQARIAGWLHDCARDWPDKVLLSFACEHKIIIDDFSLRNPVLLHAPIGAVLAQMRGVTDTQILGSIRSHTLGAPDMSVLEQIIYVADKIEPGRQYAGAGHIRHLARTNFKEALVHAAAHSIIYVIEKKQSIHPITMQFWNWLVAL